MNDDTTPLDATPAAPRRRRTALLIGAAAVLGISALGVSAAVAGTSDSGGGQPHRSYGAPRGEGQPPAGAEGTTPPAPQDGTTPDGAKDRPKDGTKKAGKSCDGGPGKGGPGKAGERPGAGRPAPRDGESRPSPESAPTEK